ncbi:MAG: hypothetical protein RG740_07535 [Acholeplasmataceae bacterium]|nr:hypothetical protein [Acholeplasmataceae bacterium]
MIVKKKFIKTMKETGIKLISSEQASNIIETRKPNGLFLLLGNNDKWVAIDNDQGDAFVEEFQSLKAAIEYLQGDNSCLGLRDEPEGGMWSSLTKKLTLKNK